MIQAKIKSEEQVKKAEINKAKREEAARLQEAKIKSEAEVQKRKAEIKRIKRVEAAQVAADKVSFIPKNIKLLTFFVVSHT